MLSKLLKYDLKNIFKFLTIFYSLALFFAVLTRIFFSIENSLIMNIIGQVCSAVAISMMFNIIINNLMRLWVRFKQSLYGDESYLTHTLPIKKQTIYLSKSITAVITSFVSVVIIALTLFVAYYSKENLAMLKNMLLPVANVYGSTILRIIIAFLFICFLEFANILQAGYIGIVLGHKRNTAKAGFSVFFGFAAYMVTQILIVVMMFGVALFNKDIMNLFYTTQVVSVDTLKSIIYMAMSLYTITLFAGYFVGLKLFKKGVNVD